MPAKPKQRVSAGRDVARESARPAARRSLFCAAAGLVLIILAVYAPSLSGEFVSLDDYQYVVDNPLVLEPGWPSVRRFFTEITQPSTVEGYYQPLTMTSLMLDASVSGRQARDPFVYHLTNVLLHAGTSILVLLLVRAAIGGVAVPILAALLFAVHPVHVESVAWISQRKTVLSSVPAVACILCYLKYGMGRVQGFEGSRVRGFTGSTEPGRVGPVPTARPSNSPNPPIGDAPDRSPRRVGPVPTARPSNSPNPPTVDAPDRSPRRTRQVLWLGASVLLYIAGGLAKPTVMLLPLVLPLLDIWPLRRRMASALVEKVPFIVCLAAMAWVAWTSQASSGAQLLAPSLSAGAALAKWPSLICYNLMLYLGNIVWPTSLSPYRELPADLSLSSAPILLSLAGTIMIAAVWGSAWRWSKALFVGGAAFVILLAPALGAVRFAETCVADRFCYLPAVFLILPLAALMVRIGDGGPRRAACPLRRAAVSRVLVGVCACLVATVCLAMTRTQQRVWRDSHALWSRVVRTAPNLSKGHAQLASEELAAGAFDSALSHARRALELDPRNAAFQHVLGRCLVRTRQPRQAVAAIRQAIARGLGPIEPLAHVSLAEALMAAGDAPGAATAAERAIALGRGRISTYAMLGDAAYNYAKRYDVAAEYYRKTLILDPDNIAVRQFLGRALEHSGRSAEALDEYERIFEICARSGIPVPAHLTRAATEIWRGLGSPTTTRKKP